MKYSVQYSGKCRKHKSEWESVLCHVCFEINDELIKLAEREFVDHQGFDIEEIRKNPSTRGLSREPHNIARAILLYMYFRENSLYFRDGFHDFISEEDLPKSEPNVSRGQVKIWIETEGVIKVNKK